MPDLEQHISAWHRKMLAEGLPSEAVAELEAHLRDDVAEQIRAGAEPQAAFESCIRRIGHARPLQAEFAKTAESKYARSRKFIRLFFPVFAGFYLLWVAAGLSRMEMSVAQRISGFVALALTVLVMAAIPWLYRWSPVIPRRKKREWLQAALGLVGPLFGGLVLRFILPHFEVSAAQLVLTVLWCVVPIPILIGAAYGMGDAAHRLIPAKKSNEMEKYA